MKVDLNQSISTHLPPSPRPNVRPNNSDVLSGSDVIQKDVARLSTGSVSMHNLADLVRSTADVRQAKVEALRALVSQGTYQVSPQRVAEAMLAQATSKTR